MNKKGFTLIEMLIVVAIVAILSTFVLVGLGPVQRGARDARRVSDLRQSQTGLELYFNKNGSYPTGVSGWTGLRDAIVEASVGITASNFPNDPTPTKTYVYGSTDGTSYTIGADLEDSNNNKSTLKDSVSNGIDCSATTRYCISL